MTRKEIYVKIKSLNLADKIKKVFGDNYTRISNLQLEDFISRAETTQKKTAAKIKKSVNTKAVCTKTVNVEAAIVRLVSTLQAACVLTDEDAKFILTGK